MHFQVFPGTDLEASLETTQAGGSPFFRCRTPATKIIPQIVPSIVPSSPMSWLSAKNKVSRSKGIFPMYDVSRRKTGDVALWRRNRWWRMESMWFWWDVCFFLWFFSVRNRWDLDLMFFFYGNYDLFRVLQNIIQIVESQDWCSGHKWPNMRGVMTARLLQSDNSMWGPYMRYLHYGFRLHMMESVFHYVLGKNLTPPFSKVRCRA